MMYIKCAAAILSQLIVCSCSWVWASFPQQLVVGEGFVEPVGFYDATPTFSWKLPVGTLRQTAYQIEVRDILVGTIVWDSGWVESDQSVLVPYGGESLASRQQLSWRVRFRDESLTDSDWSPPAHFELGLLSSEDWKAKWIGLDDGANAFEERVALLRRKITVSDKVSQARLYVTARGLYEVYLNGKKVGKDAFTPGWTSYANRIDTQTYDVTESILKGANVLGASLGYGWYAGRIGWQSQKQFYGTYPEFLGQLELTYHDGRKELIVTDHSWKATVDGPIRASSIYDGEVYDARKEMPGWKKSGFDSSTWDPVVAREELGAVQLSPKPFAPVQHTDTLVTQKITEPEPGRFIFDLGQNIVGWPLLTIPVEKDQTVTIRFAEMLNQDGSMYTANYRSAKSIDFYTPAKSGTISWKPTFTFHGFRYVELSGLPKTALPKTDWVKGLVLHTNLNPIGVFESSHKKLNQLQSNITWGQRGNFLDIPTDCPQRDERCGWTGDAQVFCPTAMFNYDCHAFWKSWLRSMRDDQFQDGRVPHVIPDVLDNRGGSPGWMDAATIIPWQVYIRTGDKELLADNYEMMERVVGWYRKHAQAGIVENVAGFGDWLQPYAPNNKGDTPHNLLATAFYAQSVQILADAASVLGKNSDADKYSAEAVATKAAFVAHFFDAKGKLRNAPETQTAYILAIAFDLIPSDLQEQAATHLVQLIDEADGHLRTGFLGTPSITQVLDQTGHLDIAYSLLFRETYPSWFFSINQGATTMWERWNSYSHKDGFGDAGMNSFNHYAYGAIGQFMYERIAGLAPDPANPGYKHFFVRPVIIGPLTSAKAQLKTAYGEASSSWNKVEDMIEMNVVVPPNTTATVQFPDGRPSKSVGAGRHRFECELVWRE
ncbi:alpha-L-rhamnosidase [Bythopirellula polymerisocia]|uniref:alpha-L-rhamnosidase n=1 Tax=Bythopirellula polymerisocia TaxID=2528003 RepID=A0A5C6CVP6_9BACT|nr:alpha-L-rhamnosidase [Bythopirellula polymerisocia]TWU28660.1 Bacterial alpha-L-rhamnosidase [Bythopirellula polymerisocia]